jgi:transcriptional regulator with XRE-family HTH domain
MGNIGDNIKRLREISGLTQKQVASQIGKTSNVISNWEKNINSPDIDSVLDLCELFKVDANTILGFGKKEKHEDADCPFNDEQKEWIRREIASFLSGH